MLISPTLGPNVLLGGVLTDVVLVPDQPFAYDWCGRCDRCVRACPTGAILPDRTVDANRCISYWTIEYRGEEFPPGVDTHGWIFGCDVCTDACPWTSKTPERANPHLRDKEDRFLGLSPEDFLRMDEDTFRERFAGTPIMRAGLKGMRRNVKASLKKG
jgi:epoxyqueuosine reductase